MRYLVELEKDGRSFTASFPDIPEALTSGASREEALEMALDALVTALDFYFEDQRQVPLPRRIPKGAHSVELPASVAAKVLLLNEMVRQSVRASDLARRLGVSPQTVNRLIDLRHATRIDSVQEALLALGKHLEISLA